MKLRAQLRRAPPFGYFALTFAWSWACWALSPAVRPQAPWPATPLMFAGRFGPSLAAIVVVASSFEVSHLLRGVCGDDSGVAAVMSRPTAVGRLWNKRSFVLGPSTRYQCKSPTKIPLFLGRQQRPAASR